jgi:hypothetical protein
LLWLQCRPWFTCCIQVLRPFAAEVPLGVFAPGRYTVVVNDELKFEFTV